MMQEQAFLYVEDDALSREIMQMIMQMGLGVKQLVMFEDSSNFMQRLSNLAETPDVIMLDIHVKPHDGFQMLAMLRADARYQHAKIIALTASVMNEEVDRLRQNGFDGAIAKPLSMQTFPDLLQRVINGESVWHIA